VGLRLRLRLRHELRGGPQHSTAYAMSRRVCEVPKDEVYASIHVGGNAYFMICKAYDDMYV
jgi:hypothetical protein